MQTANLIYLILLASFIALGVLFSGKLTEKLRHAAIWLGIFAVLFVGYVIRHDLAGLGDRVYAALFPGEAVVAGDGVLNLHARQDGHFQVLAHVNGVPVTFLVDTGASRVVLTGADAKRVGIDVETLAFSGVSSTAGGLVASAPIRLPRLTIGDFTIADIQASVNNSGLDTSLLGMSYLGRLKSYTVADGIMTFRYR